MKEIVEFYHHWLYSTRQKAWANLKFQYTQTASARNERMKRRTLNSELKQKTFIILSSDDESSDINTYENKFQEDDDGVIRWKGYCPPEPM